ncbi:MAG: universal stress protein [Candidatus Nitronauta litoralis]|uniref:Universal stress protein n=1 Tax=Candidatus Nitronauta litoralis TaxID=2705533 RepID=A0A7T0G1F8_9BACT|nr:MAG: universal stress protein [Candidatus Nitronauta litoralis]
MFKNIYVPVDNSDYSNACIDMAVEFAKCGDTTVTSSHVYAAKMHDVRFRQMESGLPEEYQDEQELEKQRAIHDQLITKGMEVITDSYLDVPRFKCKSEDVPFVGKSLEGRNWIELVRDIKESDYDLVIMGALGLGAIKDSQMGTVTERVIRRIETDTLIVKNVPELHGNDNGSGKIVVAVDGSGHCFGGLKTGIEMAKKLNRPLEVISTFDPYFHYAMFNSLTGVLSKDAAKVFKFEQQEKLHEDIIDKGLAKIYQSHLEVSRKLVEEEGMECTIRLLDGKVFEKILQYAREEKPYLLILGRIGVHSAPDMDIGGNTENLLRMVPCNVFLSSKVFKPPIDMQAEESIDWTAEAKERLKKIPGFVRPMATSAILRYSLERGHSMITSAVITEACENILPAGAMQAMYSIGDQMRDKMDKGEDPLEGMIKDRQEILYEKFQKDAEEHAETDGRDVPVTLKCGSCGAYHPSDVVKCSVCGATDSSFAPVDKDQFTPTDEESKDTTTVTTFDSVEVTWTQEAINFLEEFPEGHIRRRAHARIEKNARVQKVLEVSLEFATQIINGKAVIKKEENGANGSGGNGNGANDSSKGLAGDGSATQVATAEPEVCDLVAGQPDVDGFTWEQEAIARLEQVPKGFMRDNTRTRVIDFAKKENITNISYETCVKGIEYSVQVMSEMIQNGATIEDFLPGK